MLRTLKKNDKFAFKGDKSRVVRRTFWLIKVVPTWKKFKKRCSRPSPSHSATANQSLRISVKIFCLYALARGEPAVRNQPVTATYVFWWGWQQPEQPDCLYLKHSNKHSWDVTAFRQITWHRKLRESRNSPGRELSWVGDSSVGVGKHFTFGKVCWRNGPSLRLRGEVF
jgi:hypothetical protein